MALLDERGVPILDLSNSSKEFVDGRHQNYLDSGDDEHLLTGAVVQLHNPSPVGAPDSEDVTVFTIGGETLDEALKSVVGAFDQYHALQPPQWVASNDEHLSRLLAEHYRCEEKELQ